MKLDIDRLWAGWRRSYVEKVDRSTSAAGAEECVFCALPGLPSEESLVLSQGEAVFTVLNLYPYNPGHLMVMPKAHVAELEALSPVVVTELMCHVQQAVRALKQEYQCEGLNFGMNLGKAGGAGIPQHLHAHIVPRWAGDTNYITVIGGTKVLPEDLVDTFQRLRSHFLSPE